MLKKMYEKETYIDKPIWNNEFSYKQRISLWSVGKLYIPSLIQGNVTDLQQGSEICFEEVINKKLISCTGLKHFLQTTYHGIPVYIVDNHNHAFSFRLTQHVNLLTPEPVSLIHIDQHTDIKENKNIFSVGEDIETFVNEKTNVGNFITVAINSWIVKDVIQVRTDYALNELVNPLTRKPENHILDIDIDFRVDKEITENDIQIVRELITKAELVTIATSPYFIQQDKAIDIIKRLLSE